MNDGRGGRKTECDFVIQVLDEVDSLVQVCWELNETTRGREIEGLLNASKDTGCSELVIVTYDQEESISIDDHTIKVIPAWKWFLS